MRWNAGIWVVSCVSSLLLLSTGCLDRDLGPLNPRVGRVIDMPVNSNGIADVDLLLVIDDSGSMDEEQELLKREIPALVRGLTDPPDNDGDGEPDWTAVESLRVAVVTSDLGTTGYPEERLGRCGTGSPYMDAWGTDARFRQSATCGGGGSAIHEWRTGDDVDAFVDLVGCTADAGITGCGFEQPLLAATRALSRQAETGFPREEALLAVLVLNDEEDCSVGDVGPFYDGLDVNPRTINAYCTASPALVDPETIARDLLGDRDPSRFVFAAITGVPVDLAGQSPASILSDARMAYVPTTSNELGLEYACTANNDDGTVRSEATPGRRLAEVAGLLDGSLIRSICEADFTPAIAALTERIGSRLKNVCIDRGLTPAADGSVACVVEEVLPRGLGCADVPGRVNIGITEDGLERCEIDQRPSGDLPGWSYTSIEGCAQITFTDDAIPPFGAQLHFGCLVEVPNTGDPTGL